VASEIESGMWVYFGMKASNAYTEKFRTIYLAMMNSDNYELRIGLLSGEKDPFSLTKLSEDELAPSKIQE